MNKSLNINPTGVLYPQSNSYDRSINRITAYAPILKNHPLFYTGPTRANVLKSSFNNCALASISSFGRPVRRRRRRKYSPVRRRRRRKYSPVRRRRRRRSPKRRRRKSSPKRRKRSSPKRKRRSSPKRRGRNYFGAGGCWPGYKRVPGKTRYSKGSCKKINKFGAAHPLEKVFGDISTGAGILYPGRTVPQFLNINPNDNARYFTSNRIYKTDGLYFK